MISFFIKLLWETEAHHWSHAYLSFASFQDASAICLSFLLCYKSMWSVIRVVRGHICFVNSVKWTTMQHCISEMVRLQGSWKCYETWCQTTNSHYKHVTMNIYFPGLNFNVISAKEKKKTSPFLLFEISNYFV